MGVPDLTGTVAAGPPYCPRQAEAIASRAFGQPAILIGHSGAGPLLRHAIATSHPIAEALAGRSGSRDKRLSEAVSATPARAGEYRGK